MQNDFYVMVLLVWSKVAQRLKRLPPMPETWVWSLGQEDPLEKEMATHSSILAWRIPWTEEPGRLQSMGSQRVRQETEQLHLHLVFKGLYNNSISCLKAVSGLNLLANSVILKCKFRWSTPKSDRLYSLQPKMEKLYTVSRIETRSWLWLRSWTPYCQIQTQIEESRKNH